MPAMCMNVKQRVARIHRPTDEVFFHDADGFRTPVRRYRTQFSRLRYVHNFHEIVMHRELNIVMFTMGNFVAFERNFHVFVMCIISTKS